MLNSALRRVVTGALLAVLCAFGTGSVTPARAEAPAYRAVAGLMAVGADPERPELEMFHVDYLAKDADPARRPVTFLVNGGPGGASIFLHVAAIGPLTIASAGDGSFPPVPARLEPNPHSWIDFTDLVFIDPVGTGYSRMLPGPDGTPGDPTKYYAVDSDLDTIAWFIRQWLTENDRWGSPKALVGESYGGQRVAGLSRRLAERYAINLNRAVMISPALHANIAETRYSILGPVTIFPTQAAIAAHFGLNDLPKGTEALPAIEAFALNELTSGLVTLGRSDPEAQRAFYESVARMIGIDPDVVARARARIGDQDFAAELLQDRGLLLDRYDGTIATENPIPELPGLNTFDRSLAVLTGILVPPFMDYLGKDLGFRTPRDYIALNLEDNIGTAGPLHTTANAEVLLDNIAPGDADLVARLRAGGAVILGKASLSEFAGVIAGGTPSGGDGAVGGQAVNPLGPWPTCGSSAGSAMGVAAHLAVASVGTETSGSLIAPGAVASLVAMKPSQGLVSGAGIVPLLRMNDSAGPMARSVADAAVLLGAMDTAETDYTAALSLAALDGVRVGVVTANIETADAYSAMMTRAAAVLSMAGAQMHPASLSDPGGTIDSFLLLLSSGIRYDMMPYLAQRNASLATPEDLLAYNAAEPARRAPFGQAPFYATAGYPAITVPTGRADSGEPAGITLIGRKGQDAQLLAHAHAFEQLCRCLIEAPLR